jgi:CHAD domain-containing protein
MTAREVGWEIIHAALEEVMSKSKGDVARYPYDKLHRIRIALKRLRYACEFFTNVFADGLRKQIKRVVRYQDCLGEMQDALEARRIMQCLVDRLVADGHGTPTVLIAAGAMMQLQLETAEARREKFCATWDKFPKVTNRIEKALTERDG